MKKNIKQAGKGDLYRRVHREKYSKGYEGIDWGNPCKDKREKFKKKLKEQKKEIENEVANR